MTYNKPKKTIEVIGRHGIDVTLADGDSSSSASYAFAEFMRDDAMHIKVADITEGGSAFSGADSVIVPYHEVGAVVVDMSASSVTRPDPYGCEEEGNADCNHSELGNLMYCGSASNKAIINADGTCDDGIQDGWCDSSNWWQKMGEPTTCNGYVGVFDGVVIPGITVSENSVEFGDYLSLVRDVDPDTGDSEIRVSTLNGASHYAIYFCADCSSYTHYSTLGTLYYCGGLQNGNIIDTETGTHDAGAIETDAEVWRGAIYNSGFDGKLMCLVSNGTTIEAEHFAETVVKFGNTFLNHEVDAETGEVRLIVSNAPSHYAIYYKSE